ncbi:hypothetical protein [Cognatilysobacter terrigena]|uniref:hypothetical protein n=1 Tax=Cognatilysobacter terrigena TaxID=2488749 RepID=UPI00106215F0|nr:hypothetical protein [Lysobacter terrigena]
MEEDLQQLVAACSAEHDPRPLARGAFESFCVKHQLERATFFQLFARHVAESFAEGSLPFWAGNHAMNALAGDLTEIEGFALEIFHAFDHGEYLEGSEPPGTVPWQHYTIPMVMAALANARYRPLA